MIIYVDIDGTICTITNGQYSDAVPFRSRIEKINKLYDEGNKIVYWTARGSQTGIDWYDTTEKQLKEWGAKHHKLSLDKPHYDLYIDDKTINSMDYFEREIVQGSIDISKTIEEQIKERVKVLNSENHPPEIVDILVTDSIGEIIEKMVILHIRTWMLEDACAIAETDEAIGIIKRKIDICFKQKRPQYIEAVNKMIDNAIVFGRSLDEASVKFYKEKK